MIECGKEVVLPLPPAFGDMIIFKLGTLVLASKWQALSNGEHLVGGNTLFLLSALLNMVILLHKQVTDI